MLFSLLVSDYMHFDCLRCSQIDADATSAFIPAQIKIFTRASLLKILMFSVHSMKIFTIFIAKELISPVYLVFSKKVRLDSSRESIYMKWLAKSYFLKKIIKKRINKYNVEGYNFAQRLKGQNVSSGIHKACPLLELLNKEECQSVNTYPSPWLDCAAAQTYLGICCSHTLWRSLADTWRLYNVASTSMQCHDVASALKRRCINMFPLDPFSYVAPCFISGVRFYKK